jgi:hypothetical protein
MSIDTIHAIAEAIRTAGEVPSGHLYAQLMGVLDLETYTAIIAMLKRSGLVAEHGHLLTWTGPQLEKAAA